MGSPEKDSRPLFDAPVRVAIALGSNVGDRRAHLEYAIAALTSHLTDVRISSFHQTAPAGVGVEHGAYLNAALTGDTQLSPKDVLDLLMQIEGERGRVRPYALAPRTLDLDLILHGTSIVSEEGLYVPHPRFRERGFVLTPLAEIAGDMVDPVTSRTISRLAREHERTR